MRLSVLVTPLVDPLDGMDEVLIVLHDLPAIDGSHDVLVRRLRLKPLLAPLVNLRLQVIPDLIDNDDQRIRSFLFSLVLCFI